MNDMIKHEFVAAVTVTYNSAELLKNAINSLLNQTYDVAKIVIVDNASNDKNKAIINELAALSDKITVCWLETNSGGAGGFEAGVKFVKDNYDFDWVWLMDDDAYPSDDCLENLLKYKDRENVGCLAPLIYGVDNQAYQLYHHKMVRRFGSKDAIAYDSFDKIPEISNIDADAFVGPLIARKAVDQLGIPDGFLFIYGDDLEYTYRISRHFNVYLIRDAVINHRDIAASASGSPKAWWKDYYMHRNRLLFVDEFAKNKLAALIGKAFALLGITKRIVTTKINGAYTPEMKKKRIALLKKSIHDGIHGISGKTVDPAEHMKWYNSLCE